MAGATVAQARAVFTADTKGLDKGLKSAERSFDRTAKRIDHSIDGVDRSNTRLSKSSGVLGKALKGGLVVGAAGAATALYGLGKAVRIGIGEFNESQKVAAQTGAVIKSTGGAANVTAKQVDSLAVSIMKYSGIDDEAIKSGENMLLTFTNIRNEVGKGNDIFNQGTKILADMSVALGTDMNKSAIQLGKALNDPIKGVTALSRVGVSFTDGQKKLIASLVESGDVMGAQKIILRELTKEFGGSAKAAGQTLGGQINILRERFNNWAGDMVAKVAPAFEDVLHGLTNFLDAFGAAKGFSAKIKVVWEGLKDLGTTLLDAVRGFGQKAALTISAEIQQAGGWAEAGKKIGAAIGGAIEVGADVAKKLVMSLVHAVEENIKPIAEVGTVLLASIFVALTDPEFWAEHWQLAIAIGLAAFGGAVGRLAGKFASTMVARLAPALRTAAGDLIARFGDDLVDLAAAISPRLAQALVLVFRGLVKLGAVITNVATRLLKYVFAPFEEGAGRFQHILKEIFVFGTAVAAVRGAVKVIAAAFGDLPGRVKNALSGLAGTVKNAIINAAKGAFNAAKDIGSNVVSGIIQGIKDKGTALKDALWGAVSDAKGWVEKKLHIDSPSKLAAIDIGQPIGEGIALGIEQSTKRVTQSLVKNIQAAFKAADKAIAAGEKALADSANRRSTSTSSRGPATGTPSRVPRGAISPTAGRSNPQGGPGSGTHSYTEGPNNWQSDRAYDMYAPAGTPVVAVEDGTISGIDRSHGSEHSGRFFGSSLYLNGKSGTRYWYKHIDKIKVRNGQRVSKGQVLAEVTQWDSGTEHLHFAAENLGALERSAKAPPVRGGGPSRAAPRAAPRRSTGRPSRAGPATTATPRQEKIAAQAASAGGRFRSTGQVVAFIRTETPKYGLDADAVIAVAQTEGGLNPKPPTPRGDGGTSFGPWQLHRGGRLPEAIWKKGAAFADNWAWSPAGFRYAFSQMKAAGVSGKTGRDAIRQLVGGPGWGFERPANPAANVRKASSLYKRTARRQGDGGDTGASAVSRAEELAENARAAKAILQTVTKATKAVAKGLDPDERGIVTKRLKAFRKMVAKFMKDNVVTDGELKAIVARGKALKESIQRVFEVDTYRDDIVRQGKMLDELYAKGFFSEQQYVLAKQRIERFRKMVKRALKDGVITPAERDAIKAAWEEIGTENMEALEAFGDVFHEFFKDGVISDEDIAALRERADEIGGVLGEAVNNGLDELEKARGLFDDAWSNFVGYLEDLFDATTIRMSPNFILDTAETEASIGRQDRDFDKAIGKLGSGPVADKFKKLAKLWDDYYAAIAAGNKDAAHEIMFGAGGILDTEDEITAIQEGATDDRTRDQIEAGNTIVDITKDRGKRRVEASQKTWEDLNAVDRDAFLTQVNDIGKRMRDGTLSWEDGQKELLALSKKYGIDISGASSLLGQNFANNLGTAMTGVGKAVDKLADVLEKLIALLDKGKKPVDDNTDALKRQGDAAKIAAENMERLNKAWKDMTPEEQEAYAGGGNRPGNAPVGGPIPTARGAELNRPTVVLAGEAGREWIIPETKIPRRYRRAARALFRGLLSGRGFRGMADGGSVGGFGMFSRHPRPDRRTTSEKAAEQAAQQAALQTAIYGIRRQYAGNLYGSRGAALGQYPAGGGGGQVPAAWQAFNEARLAEILDRYGRNVTVPITITGYGDGDPFPYLARARYAAQSTFGGR